MKFKSKAIRKFHNNKIIIGYPIILACIIFLYYARNLVLYFHLSNMWLPLGGITLFGVISIIMSLLGIALFIFSLGILFIGIKIKNKHFIILSSIILLSLILFRIDALFFLMRWIMYFLLLILIVYPIFILNMSK